MQTGSLRIPVQLPRGNEKLTLILDRLRIESEGKPLQIIGVYSVRIDR